MFEEAYYKLKKKISNLISGFFIIIFNKIFTNLIFVVLDTFEDKIILRAVKITYEELNFLVNNFFDNTVLNFFKNIFYFFKNLNFIKYQEYFKKPKGLKHILLDKLIIFLILLLLYIFIFIYFCVIQDTFLNTYYSFLKLFFVVFTSCNIFSYKLYFLILFFFNLFIFIHFFDHINNILKDYIIDNNINVILSWLLGSLSLIVLSYYFSLIHIL